jgi:hypothetical protein
MPEEIVATTQPTPPATEPQTTNWPRVILVAVLGFGLLFGAAYAGYWYGTQEISNLKNQISNLQPNTQIQEVPTPQSVPSTTIPVSWEAYTNSELGYTIGYPPGWGYAEEPSGNVYFFVAPWGGGQIPDDYSGGLPGTGLSISKAYNPERQSLEKWIEVSEYAAPRKQHWQQRELDGRWAIIVPHEPSQFENQGPFKYIEDLFVGGQSGNIFMIRLTVVAETGEDTYQQLETLRPISEGMLSTFKFLD